MIFKYYPIPKFSYKNWDVIIQKLQSHLISSSNPSTTPSSNYLDHYAKVLTKKICIYLFFINFKFCKIRSGEGVKDILRLIEKGITDL